MLFWCFGANIAQKISSKKCNQDSKFSPDPMQICWENERETEKKKGETNRKKERRDKYRERERERIF